MSSSVKQSSQESLQIKLGPSGRPIAQPMDTSLVEALSEHITMERFASEQYFANSIWSAQREFRGFSKYFYEESGSEREHSALFANYLNARGQIANLENLLAPKQNFSSILDVIANSFQLEADITTSLLQIYSIAERSNDTRTTVFLDPIIENQTKSEDEFAYLYGKVNFSIDDCSALLLIDQELFAGNVYK